MQCKACLVSDKWKNLHTLEGSENQTSAKHCVKMKRATTDTFFCNSSLFIKPDGIVKGGGGMMDSCGTRNSQQMDHKKWNTLCIS